MALAAAMRRLLRPRAAPSAPARAAGAPPPVDLSWVDEFIANVRPYVFVRTEDNLLIRRPNQAQKLNREGAVLLKMLLRGSPLRRVLARVGPDPRRLEDVALFLHDVRRWLEGRLDATHRTRATEIVPLELHFSKLPVLAEIAVTYRCNLRCAFCYAGCNGAANPIGDGREMTAAEIRTVLERIYRDAKVPSVSFTGGEPTLRPELPALVRFAADLGLRVNLITNATRVTAALAAELANAGLASAQASLEGVTAGTHERLTGSPGSFARTLTGVAHLRAAGIRVHTNTTLNRANLGEAPRVPAFVRRILGLERFSMNLVIPAGSAALNARLVVRYTELGPHLEAIQRAAQAEDVEFMWYSPTPMCLFNPVAHGLGNKGCSACDGLLSVAANGDVLPCSCCDDPVGNLLREDATAIWQSATARRYRDKGFAHPACRGCADFSICHGACPLYWRQLGFGELAVRRDAPAAGKECPVP